MNKINLQNVQCQTVSDFQKISTTARQFKDFEALPYKLKDFHGLEILFPNSRTFKDFQVLYEPCDKCPSVYINVQASIMSYEFMLRRLHRAQFFWNFALFVELLVTESNSLLLT
jgi:hypothetical protein